MRQFGSNVFFNGSTGLAAKEFKMLINGKNQSRNSVLIVPQECDGPCNAAIEEIPLETNERLWSDPTSWTSGTVPAADEDVTIESGKNFVFDLENSPIYGKVVINGQVKFKVDSPKLHLNARSVFVRYGSLIIGTFDLPYEGDAQIILHGNQSSPSVVFDNPIVIGGKSIIGVSGSVSMVGSPRLSHARLTKTILGEKLDSKGVVVREGEDTI